MLEIRLDEERGRLRRKAEAGGDLAVVRGPGFGKHFEFHDGDLKICCVHMFPDKVIAEPAQGFR